MAVLPACLTEPAPWFIEEAICLLPRRLLRWLRASQSGGPERPRGG
jgi:hypothetical protein